MGQKCNADRLLGKRILRWAWQYSWRLRGVQVRSAAEGGDKALIGNPRRRGEDTAPYRGKLLHAFSLFDFPPPFAVPLLCVFVANEGAKWDSWNSSSNSLALVVKPRLLAPGAPS